MSIQLKYRKEAKAMQWIGWTTLIFGIWLICAPFILGYSSTAGALWNDIILGVLVVCFGWWAAVKLKKQS